MALAYFTLDQTPSQWDLIDTQGRAVRLYFLPGLGWGSEAMANDFYAGVNSWRSGDQINWYNQYAYQANQVIDNVVGEAFLDDAVEYDHLPTYVTTSQAFKKYGFVYIPFGAVDPRSQETLPDEGEDEEPGGDTGPSWSDIPDGDDVDGGDDLEPFPEPSIGGKVLRMGIAAGAGALAGWITYYLMPD